MDSETYAGVYTKFDFLESRSMCPRPYLSEKHTVDHLGTFGKPSI